MFEEYYSTNNCPICNREFLRVNSKDYWTVHCTNECFTLFYDHSVKDHLKLLECSVQVFGEDIIFSYKKNHNWPDLYQKYLEKIEYWKENDRYLMKLLEY